MKSAQGTRQRSSKLRDAVRTLLRIPGVFFYRDTASWVIWFLNRNAGSLEAGDGPPPQARHPDCHNMWLRTTEVGSSERTKANGSNTKSKSLKPREGSANHIHPKTQHNGEWRAQAQESDRPKFEGQNLPLHCCAILGKLLPISDPWFPSTKEWHIHTLQWE